MNQMTELRIKTSHYIIAATALVTSLSWNSSIQQLITNVVPLSEEVYAKLVYALLMTIILILMIKYFPNTSTELPIHVQESLQNIKK